MQVFGRLVCVVLIVTVQAAAAQLTPVQSYNSYRSWLAACDNTLACEVKGFDEQGDRRAEMVITRAAGARETPAVQIRAETKFALADVRIDGQPAGLKSPEWAISQDDDGTSIRSRSFPAIRAFIARLRNGAKLTLGADGAEIPLDGLIAALLRIDERQGRIGGITGLIKTGPAPAALVPNAPLIPIIPSRPIRATFASGEARHLIAAVRTSQRAIFKKEDCEDDLQPEQANAWALDGSRALVMIPCVMGAYQGSSLAFITPRKAGGTTAQVTAPLPYLGDNPANTTVDMFTEGDFDPKTGTLAMSAKGRGLADCGMSASWIWDGAKFRLSALSNQDACGGLEPGDWPTLFVSRQ